jgi:hypothetical protein
MFQRFLPVTGWPNNALLDFPLLQLMSNSEAILYQPPDMDFSFSRYHRIPKGKPPFVF